MYHCTLLAREFRRKHEVVVTAGANEVGNNTLHGRRKVAQLGRAEPSTVHNCNKGYRLLDTSVIIFANTAARPAHLLQQLAANIGVRYPGVLLLTAENL